MFSRVKLQFRFTFLMVFLFFSVNQLFSQKAILQGQVSDSATSKSLPGVNVIADSVTGVSTDVNGKFLLELKPGKYKLVFSFVGYKTEVRTITLSGDDEIELNVLLKSESVELDMAVITAGKYEQRLSDVTVSVGVMKPAFLENINTVNIGVTMNYMPGVDVLDGQASIRGGSGYSYGTGSRVLVLVDNLPMLSPAESEAKWNFIPVENIEQVEVLKGASSALYGSSALNGVINFRTTYPKLEPQTVINLYGGFYDKPKREEMAWWWESHPIFTGASFSHSQKFNDVDFVVGANGYINPGYRGDNFDEQVRVNAKVRHRPKRIEGFSYGLNTSLQWQHRSDFFIWIDADSGAYLQNPSGVSPNHGIRFNVDPFVNYFDKNNNKHSLWTRFYRNTNNFGDDPDKNNASNLYYGEYQFQKVFKNNLNWTIGLSGMYGETNAQLYGDHYNSTISIYTQLDYKFFKRLAASLGLRWERYTMDARDKESGTVVRAGLNYQAAKATFIRASFGQGYRFPSIAEKYTATRLGSINIIPNPDLESETGWSTEVGLRQGFKISEWTGFLDVAVFWTKYENMIEFTFGVYKPDSADFPTLDDVGFKSINIGNARISGVEIDITGNGSFGKVPVNLFIGYTYMDPVDLSSDTLSNDILKYRYRHSFKGDVEFNFSRFSMGLSFIYRSFMERIDEAFEEEIFGQEIFPGMKEYREKNNMGKVILDFRISYLFAPSTRLSLIAKNIFNEEYMGRPGDIHPPRNITLQFLLKL